jgi:hypothetical protein
MRAATLLLAILASTGMASAQEYLNCAFAPGWEQTGAKRQYTPDNLYDYKDGAAEGYLLYGFVTMQGIDCKSGGDTMSIDVSQMNDADSAYGMFTANRDPKLPEAKIGMGGQVQMQSAIFAKGKYFVEVAQVAANPANDNHVLLQALAAKIEARLEGSSTPPETLAWFPKEDLVSSVLIPESVLGLKLLKRGYVAKYKQGQAFIVLEASPESAAEVMKKLRARFDGATDAKIADEAFQAKAQYLGGLCIFRKGNYLAGYANLPDAQAAVSLAAQLAERIP